MANVHMILQGQDGVGKSMVAAVLAQYKVNKGATPLCLDADPVNSTFAGYESLNVRRADILKDDEIDPRSFVALVEIVALSTKDVIIDNGAASFVPLSHYIISNKVPALLADHGHTLTIHTVIAGGQALPETLSGFSRLADQFPEESPFVVWLNPFWGTIEMEGKSFEQMKGYTSHKDRVSAIIQLPELNKETHGRDFSEMLRDRETFEERLADEKQGIMTRQRLRQIQRDIFDALDMASVL